MRVSMLEELANLIAQSRDVIGRKVIAAPCINCNCLCGRWFSDKRAEKWAQRFLCDFGRRIPDSHIQGSNGDTTFAVTAGLLAFHHAVPGSKWIEVIA